MIKIRRGIEMLGTLYTLPLLSTQVVSFFSFLFLILFFWVHPEAVDFGSRQGRRKSLAPCAVWLRHRKFSRTDYEAQACHFRMDTQ
jgi:hypothetical protein